MVQPHVDGSVGAGAQAQVKDEGLSRLGGGLGPAHQHQVAESCTIIRSSQP